MYVVCCFILHTYIYISINENRFYLSRTESMYNKVRCYINIRPLVYCFIDNENFTTPSHILILIRHLSSEAVMIICRPQLALYKNILTLKKEYVLEQKM